MAKGFYSIAEGGSTEHRMTVNIAMIIDPLKLETLRADIIFTLGRHGLTTSRIATPIDALKVHRETEKRKERAS